MDEPPGWGDMSFSRKTSYAPVLHTLAMALKCGNVHRDVPPKSAREYALLAKMITS